MEKIKKIFKIICFTLQLGVEETVERIESFPYDSLTGLYNRRVMEKKKEKEVSVVFLDIDNFKEINDTYGYDEGDRALREFASVLKFYSRKEDLFVRWGGDEFILILPKTTPKEAENLVERIERKIEENIIPLLQFSHGIVENREGKDLTHLVEEVSSLMQEKKKVKSSATRKSE